MSTWDEDSFRGDVGDAMLGGIIVMGGGGGAPPSFNVTLTTITRVDRRPPPSQRMIARRQSDVLLYTHPHRWLWLLSSLIAFPVVVVIDVE